MKGSRTCSVCSILILIAIVSQAAKVEAQAPPYDQRLRDALTRVVSAQGLPGATAAVSIDGQVVAVAAGYADRERNLPMKPSDRMLVGSSGKPFVAFVALSLVREGKLDLDAPISHWLGSEPWFARVPNASQLTMRHLLTHRGGVPNHAGDSVFAAAVRAVGNDKLNRGFTAKEQIAFVLDRPAPFQAGQGFGYSDTGYLLAALVLEKIAGRTYYQELQSRVLEPLRLDRTTPSDHPDLPGLAQGYHVEVSVSSGGRGFGTWGLPDKMVVNGRLVINPAYEWTGGGLISASPDLARWMETLFERNPWKSIGDAMVTGKVSDAIYGFGIFVRQTPDGLLYDHPGGFPGYHTQVAYSPELGLGIAFQTNSDRCDGAAALHELIQAVRLAIGPGTGR